MRFNIDLSVVYHKRTFQFFFLLLLFLMVTMISCSAEDSDAIVSISPSQQIVSPGDPFTFNVSCNPNVAVKSFEFKIRFDASLIQINSVSEGDFFNGYSTFFSDGTIDNNQGRIKNIYNLILGPGNVSSENSLITVSGVASDFIGQVSIELYDIGVTDELGYLNADSIDGILSVQDEILLYNANPENASTTIDPQIGSLSIDIEEISGNLFNYSIVTSPDVGSCVHTAQSNGTKTCDISALSFDTGYEWSIAVQNQNSGSWTNQTYIFQTQAMTADDVIDISTPDPSNKSSAVSIDKSSISVLIDQSEGGLFDFSITTSPDIGSLSASSVSSGTKTCSISNVDYDATYTWTVSVKDLTSGGWVNRSFWFTVESEPEQDDDDDGPGGGFPSGGGGSFLPPAPVEDQNNAPYKPVMPSGPLYIEPGGSFSYSAQTYDPDGDQIRYRFDWGDGNLSEWTDYVAGNQSVSLSHSWYQIANFSVIVIAQDEQGLNSSWSQGLLVYCSFADDGVDEKDPVAIFEPVQNDSDDFSFRFNSTMSYDEDGNITSYLWDFGDGFTSTEKNPDHTYASPGWYNVTLLITDDDGNVYSKTMNVFIQSESTANTAETEDQSFPWMILFYVGGVVIVCVVIIFRKQLFSMFFEYVEVDEDGNPIEDPIESEGTFVDQINDVDDNLSPFDGQPGDQQDIPLGVSAELPDKDAEKDEEKHVRHHRKHRDIHFIRNLIDDHFSEDDEEE